MKKQIIVNADDFGQSSGVNEAVAHAHSQGVLTSATLMANMPAVDQALDIAKKYPALGIGLHLNVLQGPPVSAQPKVKLLTDSAGNFKYSPAKLAAMSVFSADIRDAVQTELTAQIALAIDRGLKPTHLDSHKHFHCFGAIYKIVCSLARRFGIDTIRWPWEPATVCSRFWPKVSPKDKLRAFIVRNMALRCRKIEPSFIKNDLFFGLAHTGAIDDKFWAELCQTAFSGTAEVMTHPGYADRLGSEKTRLTSQRQVELEWLCAQSTKDALARADIKLTHYGKLTESKNG